MFEPDTRIEMATQFSRTDAEHPLSTCSQQPIMLEEREWPSIEHYYQAHICGSSAQAQKILQLSPKDALAYGRPWYRRKLRGWKDKRRVLMTRAIYTKVQMYPAVKMFLLASGHELLVETSSYDYYWGIGRDLRGENMLGKVWMDVRSKLQAKESVDGDGVNSAAAPTS